MKTTTIVGCVQPSDATATNAAGVNDTKSMLTNAKSSSGDAKAASAYRPMPAMPR